MASAAWTWINSIPQPAASTFPFPSVWFLIYGLSILSLVTWLLTPLCLVQLVVNSMTTIQESIRERLAGAEEAQMKAKLGKKKKIQVRSL